MNGTAHWHKRGIMNPIIIYQSKDYNDADSIQKYIADIAKDNLNVSKSRNGDLLQVSLTGSDDAINAWLNFYKDMFFHLCM